MSSSERRFEYELKINRDVDVVWQALTTREAIEAWFAPQAEVDLQADGRLIWDWGEPYRWSQTIVEMCGGERLLTRYDSKVADGHGGKRPLFIEFTLHGERGGTRLRIVQSGFGPEAEFSQEYDGISHGWPGELRILRHWLEVHAHKPRHLARVERTVAIPNERVWAGLLGADVFACDADVDRYSEGRIFAVTVPGLGRTQAVQLDGESTAVLHEVTCRLPEFDESVLRFWSRDLGDETEVWIWLEDWAGADERRRAFETNVSAALDRLS